MNMLQYQTATLADRTQFVSKVYTLLGISMLFACAGAYFGLSMPGILSIPVYIAYFALFFICQWQSRNYPLNIMLLFTFTTVSGLLIGPLLAFYLLHGQGSVIPMAFGVTSLTFGGLSIYANVSKRDFSIWGGALNMAILALILVGFLLWFIHIPFLYALYSWAGVVIFSGYILFQTSAMTNRYDESEYVAATLGLYLGFLNLFLFVLQIMGGSSRRR